MNNNGSKFSDGLLLGIVIGGAAIFLLGTEKGKKLLKVITQEGESALSSLLEETEEEQRKEKPVKKQESAIVVDADELNFKKTEDQPAPEHKNSVEKEKPTRHFFRKTSK